MLNRPVVVVKLTNTASKDREIRSLLKWRNTSTAPRGGGSAAQYPFQCSVSHFPNSNSVTEISTDSRPCNPFNRWNLPRLLYRPETTPNATERQPSTPHFHGTTMKRKHSIMRNFHQSTKNLNGVVWWCWMPLAYFMNIVCIQQRIRRIIEYYLCVARTEEDKAYQSQSNHYPEQGTMKVFLDDVQECADSSSRSRGKWHE